MYLRQAGQRHRSAKLLLLQLALLGRFPLLPLLVLLLADVQGKRFRLLLHVSGQQQGRDYQRNAHTAGGFLMYIYIYIYSYLTFSCISASCRSVSIDSS